MRPVSRLAAALVGALLAGCASPLWVRKGSVKEGEVGGRLYVPRMFQPLLPGSIYPNRASPLPTTQRSSVVVACPERGPCPVDEIVTPLGERTLVVLVLSRPPSAEDLAVAVEYLGSRPESRGTPVGVLLYRPGPGLYTAAARGAGGRATVVLGPPPLPPGDVEPGPVGPHPFLVAGLTDEEPATPPPPAIEKLYRRAKPGDDFPPEAFRDAADWLANELAR